MFLGKDYFKRTVALVILTTFLSFGNIFSQVTTEDFSQKGIEYFQNDLLDKAIAEFNKAIEIDPKEAKNYFMRGFVYQKKGNFELAISDYNKVVEINPKNINAYLNRGSAYDQKGDPEKAISDYSLVIGLSPDNATAYYNRGLAFNKMGNFDQGIPDFTKAIEINPNFANAYINRGMGYFNKGILGQAMSDYAEALRIDPSIATAYLNTEIGVINKDNAKEYLYKMDSAGSKVKLEPAVEPEKGGIDIYGDSHEENPKEHEQIVDAIIKTEPKAVFHVGDMISQQTNTRAWEETLRIISKLQAVTEFYPAIGNRDEGAILFWKHFSLPNNGEWYSLEKEGMHFIVLDSNSRLDSDSQQYKWLENDLNSINDKKKFIVALLHHPIFSTGYHEEDEKRLKPVLVPLFEKYGVDIVFSGHDHDYERSRYHNIYYIVTGGGGGLLYGQTRNTPYSQIYIQDHNFCQLLLKGDQLFVIVYDMYLNILDKFTLTKNFPIFSAESRPLSMAFP